MGGSVQLVVRNKEGDITALPVWTNSMASLLLKNPKFLAGDFSYLTEFVNYHRELMADYDANHVTRTFKDSNAGLLSARDVGPELESRSTAGDIEREVDRATGIHCQTQIQRTGIN